MAEVIAIDHHRRREIVGADPGTNALEHVARDVGGAGTSLGVDRRTPAVARIGIVVVSGE